MRRLLLLGVFLFPLMLFGLANDALAGQTDGVKGEGGRPFTTTLAPANEVPMPTRSSVNGTAKVTINLGQHELCWDLDYKVTGPATVKVVAAHIHKGAAGTARAGNIVFGFFNPPPSTVVVNSGCRVARTATELMAIEGIVRDPGAYYVNVHTNLDPAGAGRGQLTP